MKKPNIIDGKIPSSRVHHAWKTVNHTGASKLLNKNITELIFNCEGISSSIKLKGVNFVKETFDDVMHHARIMRERDSRFLVLVDLSVHGVGYFRRKKGGYFLYIFERDSKDPSKWVIDRQYYSKVDSSLAGVKDDIEFHNVFWRIVRHCYYGVAIREDSWSDNSG